MAGESGCSFEWDESSKLYFHSSSGFYHDPSAGWYYSSRDGLYYAYEDGSYVPLEFNEGEESKAQQRISSVSSESIDDQPCKSKTATTEDAQETGCSFEWDDNSKLYFHASSGFYHDPTAGWYYNGRDGMYYRYENGSYVPLELDEGKESETRQQKSSFFGESIEDQPCESENVTDDGIEIQRPSEWLEETLINLYLSGYSNPGVTCESSITLQTSEEDQSQVSGEGLVAQLDSDKLSCPHVRQVEDEGIPEDMQDEDTSTEKLQGEDASIDEENWLAQYGQVVRATDEGLLPFPIIDIWDWEMFTETAKKGHKVAKLSGRLANHSTKFHPSVPAGSGRLKTASICDVHLDLVRVASGKVYRLRHPSRRYLASLSAYDSSNPTNDWGFPNLSIEMQKTAPDCNSQPGESNYSNSVIHGESNATHHVVSKSDRQSSLPYRDRAAERRALHGEFSTGPGQRKFFNDDPYGEESTSQTNGEEAAAEAMNLTFGQGSYARKLLEKMGWKDGQALGCTNKGIVQPLQAIGNKGNAGLGWTHTR